MIEESADENDQPGMADGIGTKMAYKRTYRSESMKKARLVEELRYNLMNWDEMTPETIARMSDAEVIERFTTCVDCGKPMLSRRDRKAVI